ncbi:hypothetical protein M5K25_005182 [Dendrobium thyrsiflorum]|uniref:Cytochrome b5 heme-binding domain-containing protein n=1 Tax=Dendrobium thyrsiflorum TaxID=117978 RepID=A0ABD0VHX4_DENTH
MHRRMELQRRLLSSFIGLAFVVAMAAALLFRFSSILRPDKPRLWMVEELAPFNGTDEKLPILLGILGSVFDVTKGKSHYGPGGGYHHFAGRDASRAFASGNFTEIDRIYLKSSSVSYQIGIRARFGTVEGCFLFLESTKIRIEMAAKKVDALEERLEGEMNQIKTMVEDRISSMEGQVADLWDIIKKMEEDEVENMDGRKAYPESFRREDRGGRYGERVEYEDKEQRGADWERQEGIDGR